MADGRHAADPARPASRTASTAPVLLIAAAVLVVVAAAVPIDWTLTSRYNPLDAPRTYSPTPRPEPTPTDLGVPAQAPLPGAATAFAVVFVLLAALALVLLARYLWSIRPRRVVAVVAPPPPVPIGEASLEEQGAALRRGALSALEVLDEIAEPRDAVVRSWLALEQAALSSGAGRRPADSPTEFVRVLLASTGADRDATTELLRLYHRARFSTHEVGLAEVQRARHCVSALARSLDGYEAALRRGVTPHQFGSATERGTR